MHASVSRQPDFSPWLRSFSNEGAMPFNFATLLLLMCELSALLIAVRRAAIRSAGKACDRSN